ncbi:MAG TPA: hypothetical protein VF824_15175 [Thermoanaerobaculia bacterium]|jgi:hypothetical protein
MRKSEPAARAALLLLIVCVSCKPAPKPAATRAASGPQVRATVVTIKTTIQPENRTTTHTLVIAGNRARSTDEHDTWRLFDTKANTVTFVDDIAKTIRTEPLAAIVKRRRETLAKTLPPHYPRAQLVRAGARRAIAGVNAEQSVITAGAYRRELWLAEHPSIPRGLFAMLHASDVLSSPLAPMMRVADDALVATRAFPMLDHAELAIGKEKMVIDRAVVSVEQRDVPEAMVTAPKGYRDVTPRANTERGTRNTERRLR